MAKDMEDFSGNRVSRFVHTATIAVTDTLFAAIDPWMDRLYYHMEVGKLNRRLALYAGFGVSIYATFWSFGYAQTHSGSEVALVIAAVLGPANFLAGALFKFYNDGRAPSDTNMITPSKKE